ncbi:MAG: hypothetical protein ACLTBV_20975 [Enterocloster bolteae]
MAQVELITKTGDSLTGSRYQIEGGAEKGLEEIGAPDGTTIIARNLFYNTPARKKFLKTPMTEGAHVAALVEKIALSHPDISIRFIQNNQNKLLHLRKPQPEGPDIYCVRTGDCRKPSPGGNQ